MVPIRTLRGALALAAALALTPHAGAAVITAPSGVLDTNTGLSWLRLDATANTSFDALSPRLAPGGDLAAYRLATGAEVGTLVDNRFAGLSPDAVRAAFFDFVNALGATPLRDGSGTGSVLEFGGIYGATGPSVTLTPVNGSGARTGPDRPDGTHLAFIVSGSGLITPGPPATVIKPVFDGTALPDSFTTGYALSPLNNTNFRNLQLSQGFFTSQDLSQVAPVADGFWLVQAASTAVPEPGSTAMLCLGLAGLALLRRKGGQGA